MSYRRINQRMPKLTRLMGAWDHGGGILSGTRLVARRHFVHSEFTLNTPWPTVSVT